MTGGTSSNALRCHITKTLLSLKPQSFRLAQESALEQKPEKRALAPGQVLCRAGERKSDPWHLDSGILYVTEPRRGGPPEIVELAFPGALLGIDFLKNHAHNITALVSSNVTVWPRAVPNDLLQILPNGPKRQNEAVEREFASRRCELVEANRSSPV